MTFLVCLVLGYGLKYFWNIINVLQFFIFMQRWQIILPLLAQTLLSSLKMLVLFEFVPTQELITWMISVTSGSVDKGIEFISIEDGNIN